MENFICMNCGDTFSILSSDYCLACPHCGSENVVILHEESQDTNIPITLDKIDIV